MTGIELGKEKLKNAMIEYCKNFVKAEEMHSTEEVVISPKIEKRMQKLVKRRKNPLWKFVNTPIKRLVAACLVIIILCGALMSFRPIREPVAEFFVNMNEKFTELFSSQSDFSPNKIEEVKTFAYVPEGYELESITNNYFVVTTVWKNKDGKKLELNQLTKKFKVTFDTENAEYGILNNNGIEVFYSFKNGLSLYYWVDENYNYTIFCYDELPIKEILKMIDSLE